MKPNTRLILRATLPVFVVSAVMIAALFSGVVAHVRAANAADGFRSVDVRFENATDDTRLDMVQDSLTFAQSSPRLNVPLGRHTLLADYGPDGRLRGLAITSGEDEEIFLGARSTAASLVALTPGVLSADTGWLGTVGHLVSQPAFSGLMDAVADHDLRSAEVAEALSDTLVPLRETGTDRCEDACGEWLASSGAVIVENVTSSRAVLVATGDVEAGLCGSVAPARHRPGDGALIAGSAATVGRETVVALDPAPAVEASLTRIDASACDRDISIITAGTGDVAERQAAWVTLLADYGLPLMDMVSGQRTGFSAEALDEVAAAAIDAEIEPSVDEALALLGAETQLSEIQAELITQVAAIVGDGLLAGGGDVGSHRSVVDAPAETPSEPTPSEPTPSTPTPETPAPSVPVPTAPVMGGALTTSYQTGQPQGAFEVTVTATNTGEGALNLAATSWRLAGPGGTLTPTAVPASLGQGSLAPGASTQGVLRFALQGAASSYRMEWQLQPGLTVGADL